MCRTHASVAFSPSLSCSLRCGDKTPLVARKRICLTPGQVLSELMQSTAESASHLGQALSSEEEQQHQQDDQYVEGILKS